MNYTKYKIPDYPLQSKCLAYYGYRQGHIIADKVSAQVKKEIMKKYPDAKWEKVIDEDVFKQEQQNHVKKINKLRDGFFQEAFLELNIPQNHDD